MNKLDLQFQIDQLRKDKIIYAQEATATSVTALVISFLGGMLTELSYVVNIIVLIFATIFWSYAMIGNYFRLQKIRKLESQL